MMAQYAARLAKENKPSNGADPTIQQQTLDTTQKSQRELITQLESKNKEIMREIQKLRWENELIENWLEAKRFY